MQTTPTISTNKIVFLLVFICAALMASVFIVHMRQQQPLKTLAAETGILFPVPRDIKSFELVTTDEKKFSLENFYHHWTLVFFGFTHCASICPSTLDMMQKAYGQLHNQYSNLQVVLISLDPERDTLPAIASYVHAYHPAFVGVSGKLQELRKLQSQLGVYSGKDARSNDTNYQLQHTASIMLINPQGKWAGLFKFGLNPEQFTTAFNQSMKILNQ